MLGQQQDAPIAMLARRGLGQWNVGEDIEFGSEIIGIGRQRADHRHRDANIVGAREIMALGGDRGEARFVPPRSEEPTSELQSLMRISYAVFCLKKKKNTIH